MYEIISMREPLYFIGWCLGYFAFHYITAKSMLKEKHLPITLTNCIIAFAYIAGKYIPGFNFAITSIVAVLATAITTIVIRKQQKPFKTIGSILLLNAMAIMGEILIGAFLLITFGNNFTSMYDKLYDYQDYTVVYYFGILTMVTSALLFSGIIKVIINRKSGFLNYSLKYLFFLWLPITHVAFYIMLFTVMLNNAEKHSTIGKIAWAFVMVVFTLDILTFLVVDRYERIEQENKRYEQQLFQNKLDYQQTLLMKENKKEVSKIRHDILNILSTAKGFIEIENYNKALNILQNATDDLYSLKGVPLCSNDTLNTILQIKTTQAEKEKIKLDIQIDEEAPLSIDDYNLCRIIGNLIDNAINGIKKINGDTIKILIVITVDEFKITTENTYDKNSLTPAKGHGKGKDIVKEIASKYKGTYTFEESGENYITTTVLKNSKI